MVNPKPIALTCDSAAIVNVHLELAPAPDTPVTVIIDSTAGSNYFLVSPCTLTFTAANYNVPQKVYIEPVFSNSINPPTPVSVPPLLHCLCTCCSHWCLCDPFTRWVQTVNIVFTATGYSSVFNGDFLSSIFASTGTPAGTAIIDANTGNALAPKSLLPVTKEVAVVLVKACQPACRSWGDPHVTTFDGNGYHPQVPGAGAYVCEVSGWVLLWVVERGKGASREAGLSFIVQTQQ